MFVTSQQVRFAHVDAAGIVFYPRYFELLNAAVEDFFADEIGVSFAELHLHRRIGIPTVKLDVDFVAPSRLGDVLEFGLDVVRTGRSSAELAVEIRCDTQVRVKLSVVLVCIDLTTGRSIAWPRDIRPPESV